MLQWHASSQVAYLPGWHYSHYSDRRIPQPQKSLDIITQQGCSSLPKLQILRLNLDIEVM